MWVPIRKIIIQIQSSEMNFLRESKGCIMKLNLCNENIRKEIQVFSMNDTIQKYCME